MAMDMKVYGVQRKPQKQQHTGNCQATANLQMLMTMVLLIQNDLKVIGNAFPDFIFGWTNRLSYSNFDLTFLIQGSKGNDLFNMGRIRLENPGEGSSARLLDRWTPDNQDTDVPGFIDGKTREDANLISTVNITGDQRLSRWVEDASYIRLKNITLGYNVPRISIKQVTD